jgi:iron complex outermembrane receptor protein
LANGGADLGANTNWLDEVSTDAFSSVHNLSFSNSTQDGLNYRASINYRDVEGVLDGTGFDQFNARINVSQQLLDDKLKLTAILSVTDRDSNILPLLFLKIGQQVSWVVTLIYMVVILRLEFKMYSIQ